MLELIITLDIIHLLGEKGALVSYHDPYTPSIRHEELRLDCVKNLDNEIRSMDCFAIITNHSDYDYKKIMNEARLIVDTHNALNTHGQDIQKIVRL